MFAKELDGVRFRHGAGPDKSEIHMELATIPFTFDTLSEAEHFARSLVAEDVLVQDRDEAHITRKAFGHGSPFVVTIFSGNIADTVDMLLAKAWI